VSEPVDNREKERGDQAFGVTRNLFGRKGLSTRGTKRSNIRKGKSPVSMKLRREGKSSIEWLLVGRQYRSGGRKDEGVMMGSHRLLDGLGFREGGAKENFESPYLQVKV